MASVDFAFLTLLARRLLSNSRLQVYNRLLLNRCRLISPTRCIGLISFQRIVIPRMVLAASQAKLNWTADKNIHKRLWQKLSSHPSDIPLLAAGFFISFCLLILAAA